MSGPLVKLTPLVFSHTSILLFDLKIPFFRSLIAATNASRNHLFLLLPPFFCSTAPQAFLHPDRGYPRPTRAEAVQIGRRSECDTSINASRPHLDSLKSDGTLVITGPEGILFGSLFPPPWHAARINDTAGSTFSTRSGMAATWLFERSTPQCPERVRS